MNIPVIAGPVEATATGNILAQAIACGALRDLGDARKTVRSSFDLITYAPEEKSVAMFRSIAGKFAKITA